MDEAFGQRRLGVPDPGEVAAAGELHAEALDVDARRLIVASPPDCTPAPEPFAVVCHAAGRR